MDAPAEQLRIELLNGKIATLERRLGHLRRRLEEPSRMSSASADFDKAEVAALDAAVRALRFHGAQLEPDSDPVLALDELSTAVSMVVDKLSDGEVRRVANIGRLIDALTRARAIVERFQ